MINSGDAAEQMVRMMLEGGEVALRISGQGARQVAAMLYAIAKQPKRSGGRARLETLVRSSRELQVFSIRSEEARTFVRKAKPYGILYCAVKGKEDGMVDLLVRGEDAARVSRIVEKYGLSLPAETAARVEEEKRPFPPARGGSPPRFERISGRPKTAETISSETARPSVRKTLRDIQRKRAEGPQRTYKPERTKGAVPEKGKGGRKR